LPKYAKLNDYPVIFDDDEAWECIGGEWKPLEPAEAHHKAGILTKEQFNAHFGELPALPSAAFQSGDNAS
jgi:hypothetical protein